MQNHHKGRNYDRTKPCAGKISNEYNFIIRCAGKNHISLICKAAQVTVINEMLKKGTNVFAVEINENWQPGVYNALLKINQETFTTRFVVLE